MCLTDSDHNFTLYEIKCRYKIEYDRNMSVDETYE